MIGAIFVELFVYALKCKMSISDCFELCFSNLGCVSVGFDDHEKYTKELTEKYEKNMAAAKNNPAWKNHEAEVEKIITDFRVKKEKQMVHQDQQIHFEGEKEKRNLNSV